jgi:predicted Zn-ribbon and HTH transcriptional regulator
MLGSVTPAVRRVKRTITVWLCVCKRCGHQWDSSRPTVPVTCPTCKARNWQRPARPYKQK